MSSVAMLHLSIDRNDTQVNFNRTSRKAWPSTSTKNPIFGPKKTCIHAGDLATSAQSPISAGVISCSNSSFGLPPRRSLKIRYASASKLACEDDNMGLVIWEGQCAHLLRRFFHSQFPGAHICRIVNAKNMFACLSLEVRIPTTLWVSMLQTSWQHHMYAGTTEGHRQ